MGDQAYTVERVTGTKDKPGKYGPMKSVFMDLKGEGSVDWFTKATTPDPKPGDELFGSVSEGQYGKTFKKAAPQGGFGGGRGMDPATQRRVTRLAAQERALRYMHVKGVTDFKLDDSFRKVIKWFADDAEAAEKS